MQGIRIVEMPDCQMVSSGIGMFGEEKFTGFFEWFTAQPYTMYPKNFLYFEDGKNGGKSGFHWLYMLDAGVTAPDGYDVLDFKGGLYAVATDIDQQTDMDALDAERDAFLDKHGFAVDESRPRMGNVITSPAAEMVLGYSQMDYYTPIQAR